MTELSTDAIEFLKALRGQTNGDSTVTVSMFSIGETMGLDKERAGAVGEELIGWGLVEVRTLSGGIAITEAGLEKAGGDGAEKAATDPGTVLGPDPLLGEDAVAAVDGAAARIKSKIDDLGIGFDGLSELMADLKTVGAQLSSPRPKTAVIRECLRSMIGVLDTGNGGNESRRLRQLLGE